jgi:hypothetical protein
MPSLLTSRNAQVVRWLNGSSGFVSAMIGA